MHSMHVWAEDGTLGNTHFSFPVFTSSAECNSCTGCRPRARCVCIGKWVAGASTRVFRFRIVCAGEPRGAAATAIALPRRFRPGSPAPPPSRSPRFVSGRGRCTPRGTADPFIRTGGRPQSPDRRHTNGAIVPHRAARSSAPCLLPTASRRSALTPHQPRIVGYKEDAIALQRPPAIHPLAASPRRRACAAASSARISRPDRASSADT